MTDRYGEVVANVDTRAYKVQMLYLGEDDRENPRAWSRKSKLANVAVIATMSSELLQIQKCVRS